jgi:hypothetical protein
LKQSGSRRLVRRYSAYSGKGCSVCMTGLALSLERRALLKVETNISFIWVREHSCPNQERPTAAPQASATRSGASPVEADGLVPWAQRDSMHCTQASREHTPASSSTESTSSGSFMKGRVAYHRLHSESFTLCLVQLRGRKSLHDLRCKVSRILPLGLAACHHRSHPTRTLGHGLTATKVAVSNHSRP